MSDNSIKDNYIVIDLNKWTTQQKLATERGCSIQYINRLIKQGKIKCLRLDEIGLVLVEKTQK